MVRIGVLAAFLALLCGCTGSGSETGAEPSTQTTPRPPPTTTQPATTTEEVLPDVEGWASREEIAWLEEFGRWWASVTRGPEGVLDLSKPIAEGSEEMGHLEEQLAAFTACLSDLGELVPAPPTARLQDATGLVEAACERYQRGAALLLERLRAGESGRGLDGALQELSRARTSFGLVNDRIPPGEAQRLPIADAPRRRSHVNPRYGRVAGTLVDVRVEVRCWGERDWRRLLREVTASTGTKFTPQDTGAYASVGGSRVNLSPSVCGALDLLTYHQERPSDPEGRTAMSFAVAALTHEAFHRAGVVDEAVAECYGMQRIDATARELGAPRGYARSLARLAWETYGELPKEYRSPECRSGRELDLDPVIDGPWDY